MIKINRIIWEDWNINHLAKHEVTPTEVEEVLHGKFVARPTYRERLMVIGKSKNGRMLTIFMHEDEKNIYYIVTARDAALEEQEIYEKEINN